MIRRLCTLLLNVRLLQYCILPLLAIHTITHTSESDNPNYFIAYSLRAPMEGGTPEHALIYFIKKNNEKAVRAILKLIDYSPFFWEHHLMHAQSIEMMSLLIEHRKKKFAPLPTLSYLIEQAMTREYDTEFLIPLYKKAFPEESMGDPLSYIAHSTKLTNKNELAQCILQNLNKRQTKELILQPETASKGNALKHLTDWLPLIEKYQAGCVEAAIKQKIDSNEELKKYLEKKVKNVAELKKLKTYLEEQLEWAQTEDVNLKPAKNKIIQPTQSEDGI